jgi:hypothetical protein
MTWTILYLHFLLVDNISFVGQFPTQAKCLASLKEANSYAGSEVPADLRQCVYIEQSKIEQYYNMKQEDEYIRNQRTK